MNYVRYFMCILFSLPLISSSTCAPSILFLIIVGLSFYNTSSFAVLLFSVSSSPNRSSCW
eukprot:c42892_g1_i1 orf=106-285(+)